MTAASHRPLRFTDADARRAFDEWGSNCGPGAIAAVLGMTLDELRPHLDDFEKKKYMSPTMVKKTLTRLGTKFQWKPCKNPVEWPAYGLARIQWHGPWMKPGVPMVARYWHTHWVGYRAGQVFDINAIHHGGWISLEQWAHSLVPHILRYAEPKSNGIWTVTHTVEVEE